MQSSQGQMTPASFEFGNLNHTRSSCKVQTYLVSEAGKEIHITTANELLDGFTQLNLNSQPAFEHMSYAEGGFWSTLNGEVAEGTIVKFFVARKRQLGIPARLATLYRFRKEAPLISLHVDCGDTIGCTKRTVNVLLGRADRITLEEAKAYGYRCNSAYEKFFDQPDEGSLIVTNQLAEGLAPEPKVVEEIENSDGEKSYRIKKVELRRIRKRKGR